MKKIVTIAGALAMAASLFAADFSATVKMDAIIANKKGDDVEFLTITKKDQKDNDALIFSGNGEKAGGQFQFWYNFDGTNGENPYQDITKKDDGTAQPWELTNNANGFHGVRIRNVNLWFKPIDALKVTVGNVTFEPNYKEHIFWWHGVYGDEPGSWGAFGGEYLAGVGTKIEWTVMDGLNVTAAFLPGIDMGYNIDGEDGTADDNFVGTAAKPLISTKDGYGYRPLGIGVKYNFGVASAGIAYADKGKGGDKIIGIGGDFGNEWAEGFYAFLNANIRLNGDGELVAMSFDNSEKFVTGAITIQAHLPVSLWKVGDDMKAGMHATLKGTYALDTCSIYALFSNEPDGEGGWKFDDFKFDLTIRPGVTFSVGGCNFDVSFRADIADGKLADWKVPVEMNIGL